MFARRIVLAFTYSVAAISALCSCSGKDALNPGTKLGTFHVTASLTQSTCGAVPNPWEFDVRLNHDGATLFWIQGGMPIQGLVDASARTTMKTEMVQQVRPEDPKARIAACSVMRTDALAVSLSDEHASPAPDPSRTASFAGGLVYSFTPTEGSDCADQVATSGGGFEALPCEVHYDISGVLKAPPN
jgi:hypothetical protein